MVSIVVGISSFGIGSGRIRARSSVHVVSTKDLSQRVVSRPPWLLIGIVVFIGRFVVLFRVFLSRILGIRFGKVGERRIASENCMFLIRYRQGKHGLLFGA